MHERKAARGCVVALAVGWALWIACLILFLSATG